MTAPIEDQPDEVAARLQAAGSDRIRDFLLASARNVQFRDQLNRLPNRKGFREDSDGNTRYKCLQLAKALVGEESTIEQPRARRLYDSLWQIIADGRLSGHWSNPEPLRRSKSSVDELLLRINEDKLHIHSRDEVRDVLKLAPFELSDGFEAELELLPTANDLGTVGKLGALEQRMDEAFRLLDKLASRIEQVDTAPKATAPDAAMEARLKHVELLLQKSTEALVDTTAHVSTSAFAECQQEIATIKRDLVELAKSATEARSVDPQLLAASVIPILQDYIAEYVSNVAPPVIEAITPLSDNVARTGQGTPYWPARVGPTKAMEATNGVAKVKELTSAEELENHLYRAFQCLGISKASARSTAIAAAGGLLATRWITVYGSLATQLASAISLVVGGGDVVMLAVPIGCLDEAELPTPNECALFFGADRAPVEIYAGDYRRRTISRIRGAGKTDDPYTIAICEGGASSLSTTAVLATLGPLGPIIATDALGWLPSIRNQPFDRTAIGDTLRSLVIQITDEADDDDASTQLFQSSALWQSSLKRYLGAISLFSDQAQSTAVVSTTYSAPRLASLPMEIRAAVPPSVASELNQLVVRMFTS